MKKTGEALKDREDKGLSLHEIGLSLKINSKILKAIEDGDMENLPAKTFLRGFVQSYAHYLRLDSEEILNLFTEEMGSTRPSPLIKSLEPLGAPGMDQNILDEPPSVNIEKPKFFPPIEFKIKTFIYGFVILCLVGLIFTVKKVVDRYQREAIVESVTVESPLPDPVSDPAATAEITGPSSSGKQMSSEGIKTQVEPTPVPKPANTSESKSTDPKPEHKSQLKFETKAEEKPQVKGEAKVEAKVEAKIEPKPEPKPDVKPEPKPDLKPEVKTPVKVAESKPALK